jgi:hypothetical protein
VRCVHCDLDDATCRGAIAVEHAERVAFAYAAPSSRDLSRVGMRWWARKREANPHFQEEAVARVRDAHTLLEALGAPFFVLASANSVLDARWRPRDATFQPHEFGRYLDAAAPHPLHAAVVPKRDAYTQKQALWTGGGFRVPPRRAVPPTYKLVKKKGVKRRISPIASWKARAARRGVPHGFATAVHARLGGAR